MYAASSPTSRIIASDTKVVTINDRIIDEIQERNRELNEVLHFLKNPPYDKDTIDAWKNAHPGDTSNPYKTKYEGSDPTQRDIKEFYNGFIIAYHQLRKGSDLQERPGMIWSLCPQNIYDKVASIVRRHSIIMKLRKEKQAIEAKLKEQMQTRKDLSQKTAAVAELRSKTRVHPVWTNVAKHVGGKC